MANAFNDTSSIAGLVQTAYDRYVEFALRAQPMIRAVADKKPVQQAMPGSSVVFSLYNDLAAATSTLTETTDPDAVALSNVDTVSVTLNEYGNASLVTRKLQLFSLSDVDPAVADIIAFNMADSLDIVAQNTLRQGTNVIYGGTRTSTATVTASDTIDSADIRKAVAKLRSNKAVPRAGSLYWVGIHPEVSHDLRAESGSVGWRDTHAYTDASLGNLFAGTIGTYEGAFFVENSRMFSAKDGADQTDLATAPAVSGVSGEFTIVAANGCFRW
jgi:N4-gp56 family major capsid protein